jgi:hypothetical protein
MLTRDSRVLRAKPRELIFTNWLAEAKYLAPTKLQIGLWVALVGIAVIISYSNFNLYQLGTHIDDARYVLLAKAMVSQGVFGMTHEPGTPTATWYPFGYPLLLTPIVGLFPDDPNKTKLLSLIATIVNAAVLFWGWHWFSRQSRWWAVAVVGLYLLSPVAIDHSRRVMAEPVFTTFCLTSILLAEYGAARRTGYLWPVIMATSLIFAMFTRTIGIVLVAVLFSYLLLRKGLRFIPNLALIIILMVVVLGAIVAVTPIKPNNLLPTEYFNVGGSDLFANIGFVTSPEETSAVLEDQTVEKNEDTEENSIGVGKFIYYFVIGAAYNHFFFDLRQAVLPVGGGFREAAFGNWIGLPFLPILIGGATFFLVCLGYFYWYSKEGITAFNLFPVIYFGSLFLWVWSGPRFLYPIQPQLIFGFLLGITAVLQWVSGVKMLSGRFRTGVEIAVVLVLITGSIFGSLRIQASSFYSGDIEHRTQWLKDNSSSSAVIMTDSGEVDYMYSNRQTVSFPNVSSPDDLYAHLQRNAVDYILVAPEIRWYETGFEPNLSDRAGQIAPLLSDLEQQKLVKQVHKDENSIAVFQVIN